MTALAASDVTVTITQQRKVNGSPTRRHNGVTVVFGDGALTYPTGGVPMPAGGSFGMPNLVVESMSTIRVQGLVMRTHTTRPITSCIWNITTIMTLVITKQSRLLPVWPLPLLL